MHKIHIMQVLYDLRYGGSERLAIFISENINPEKFSPIIVALYGSGPLETELANKEISYKYFTKVRKYNRAALQIKFTEFLLKNKVDIVQVHGSYPLTRIFFPAKVVGVKIIYTEHAKYSLENTPRLKFFTRLLGKKVDRVVSVSENLRKYLVYDLKIPLYKTEVIHNGVDLSVFDYRKRKHMVKGLPPKNGFIFVGVVGRLTAAKDHENLFKAWRKVCNVQKNLHLVVIGDGELREKLKSQVDKFNLKKQVTFLGQRNDIADIISAMDLMVLSSKREGFPISILEYLAMQKPLIATNVGGIPEIIENGKNGILVSPGNDEDMAEAICRFADNRREYNKMAKTGRMLIEEKYDKNRIIGKYETLYENVYSGKI